MRTGRMVVRNMLLCFIAVPALASNKPYRVVEVINGGKITGQVRLQGAIPKSVRFTIPKDNDWCGTTKRSPRLVLGENGGVANTVVWLEGIDRGKGFERAPRYVLDQRNCEYEPHVLLLPWNSAFEIMNSDAVLHNVRVSIPGKVPRTVFNIAQPIKGLRSSIKGDKLDAPGIYHATCDAGHPWMSAYIVVAEHPYYAVTGKDGRFTLSNIPAGTYTLRMWREGVAVTKTHRRSAEVTSYEYEEPYELLQTVTVTAGSVQHVSFDLSLRPQVYSSK